MVLSYLLSINIEVYNTSFINQPMTPLEFSPKTIYNMCTISIPVIVLLADSKFLNPKPCWSFSLLTCLNYFGTFSSLFCGSDF